MIGTVTRDTPEIELLSHIALVFCVNQYSINLTLCHSNKKRSYP